MKNRSRVHMLTVAAARLETAGANPTLIKDLRTAAGIHASRRAESSDWSEEEQGRVERQRTVFAMLPSMNSVDRLREAMLQRAYDLLWDGDCTGCDALLEFLPEKDVDRMFAAWQHDQSAEIPKTAFYGAL